MARTWKVCKAIVRVGPLKRRCGGIMRRVGKEWVCKKCGQGGER